jgi:ATP-dependent DNA helicase RecQ
VYATLRQRAENIVYFLKENCKLGDDDVRCYHAGMTDEERSLNQAWFQHSKNGIIVATIAFGLGVDKKDIR